MKKTAAKLMPALSALLLAASVGCGVQRAPESAVEDRGRVPDVPEEGEESDPYTPEMLAAHRAAIPSFEALEAPAPSSDMQAQVGDPAA